MRSSRPELFCKNGVLTNFAKFTKNTKKIFHYRCFLVNSAKFLITSFLKSPSDGCFCINTRSVYFPTTTFRLFKKRCRSFFLAEYFLGFICRLGTKVSSICKTLSQKSIFSLFKYLGWSFSCEKVDSSTRLGIFTKKLHCRCSTMF